MRNKIIPFVNFCLAFFVILYAAHVYTVTQSITLVTVVLLIAGLAPVLHTSWNYIRIKYREYRQEHSHHNHNYMKG
ncbi:MAG TPA: intracellular septation protein [Candidatus Blautia pullicola]|jgi:hypothetical protein|uniref:Intracellular septation protein n=1 Tax=Candidatus Blautia pullicola TaxID=2838498 RepID=A0A9D2FT43_9FIRM|nr:intracellular septation protein [Candidatus Blautia pullicola]